MLFVNLCYIIVFASAAVIYIYILNSLSNIKNKNNFNYSFNNKDGDHVIFIGSKWFSDEIIFYVYCVFFLHII